MMKNIILPSSALRITITFLLDVLFLFIADLSGQVPEIVFEKCFGGNGWDIPYSAQKTADTGFIVFGSTTSIDGDVHENKGDRDLWIIKLNAEFDTIWTKCLGGSGRDWACKIIQTQDGGYILCAETYSFDGDVHGNHSDIDQSDAWIIRLNALGDTLWTKCLGGSLSDELCAIVEIPGEGYILSGNTSSVNGDVHGNHGDYDLWVVKINLLGDTLWTKCYGGTGIDVSQCMTVTNDASYVLAGYTTSNDGDIHGNNGSADYYLMKVNDSGDTLWTRSYGGSDSDGIYSVIQTTDHGYLVSGYTLSDDFDVEGHHGDYDAWVMKLDETGNIIWKKCYGGSASEYNSNAIQLSDGKYLLAGYTESVDGDVHGNHGERDCWLVKLGANGDTLWTYCFGGSMSDEIQDILETGDGFVLTCFSDSYDEHVLSERYESWDFWMVKLAAGGIVDRISLNARPVSVYPNPTEGILVIGDESMDKYQLLDLTGKVILQSKEREVDLTTYKAGLYIVRLFDKYGQATAIKIIKR